MAENYEGRISTLQVEVKGNEAEQRWCKLVNYILYVGKICDMRQYVEKDEFYGQMVDEIHKSVVEWEDLENRILTSIETYLNKGKYDMDGLETCVGTLTYLTEVYSTGKNLKYLHHGKVQKLLNIATKVSNKYYAENKDDDTNYRKGNYIDGNNTKANHKKLIKKQRAKHEADMEEFEEYNF